MFWLLKLGISRCVDHNTQHFVITFRKRAWRRSYLIDRIQRTRQTVISSQQSNVQDGRLQWSQEQGKSLSIRPVFCLLPFSREHHRVPLDLISTIYSFRHVNFTLHDAQKETTSSWKDFEPTACSGIHRSSWVPKGRSIDSPNRIS